jgi:transposase
MISNLLNASWYQSLRDALEGWSLAPVVAALQALRGVQLIAAITLVAEIQDFHRFANPRQSMAYLGLVPSERSSGQRRRQGAITTAGNSAVRRMLVPYQLLHRALRDPRRMKPCCN